MKFDTTRLIADLGGPAKTAALIGAARTTPYRWLKTGTLSLSAIQKIKAARPDLSLDAYWVAS